MDIENVRTGTWDESVRAGYIYVNATGKVAYTETDVSAMVNVDVDEQGEIVGIEILL